MKLRLVQLPIPPPAALAATGNVPLAAGCLAVATKVSGLSRVEVEVVAPAVTERLGDTRLAELVAADEPEVVGLSLYLWNVERSLHLAREVKRRSPRTRVLIGGPEVTPDNPRLLAQEGFDVAVAGEGEEALPEVLARMLDGGDVAGVAGVSVRSGGAATPFGPPRPATFGLAKYPSPYLEGVLPVEAERSVYVEGARGCRSKCTFCFYPKTGSGLRLLHPAQLGQQVRALRGLGAREITFLDPTFNHRPDFEPVLDALIEANADGGVTFFAEVRPEGLSAPQAKKLAKAGFTRLELGLQSVNTATLKRIARGGSPAKLAEAAKLLKSEGIELLIDLIVGLPGDTAADVARGVDFLLEQDLGDSAQVFTLQVLPGTAMRAGAERDGLVYDDVPPYRLIRSATMDEATLAQALADAEDALERPLDDWPRPHLVDEGLGVDPPDVFRLDVDRATEKDRHRAARPGAPHCALWLEGEDLFAKRAELIRAIDARRQVDPFATLDVVLVPALPFPLDLLTALRRRLAGQPSYSSRVRLTVVLRASASMPGDWLNALMSEVPVFRDQPMAVALAGAAQLGDRLPAARIIGAGHDANAIRTLERAADAESVVFADRSHELAWQRHTLGYADVSSPA